MTNESRYLWGRYKDWGSVDLLHVLTMTGVFLLVVFVYGYISKCCSERRNKMCNNLMNGRLRMNENLKKRDEKAMYKLWAKQKALKDKLKAENPFEGDNGWDIINNNNIIDNENINDKNINNYVNINRSISKSYIAVEEMVRSSRRDLRHTQFRTIRQFIQVLPRFFDDVNESLCQSYIDYYELARFGNYKFTNSEYKNFLTVLSRLLQKLDQSNE